MPPIAHVGTAVHAHKDSYNRMEKIPPLVLLQRTVIKIVGSAIVMGNAGVCIGNETIVYCAWVLVRARIIR
jgi:hypothetical protein